MSKLTAKQEKFVREYVKDFNGLKAAIRAGYSEKGARQRAFDLLTNGYIMEKIKEKQSKLKKMAEEEFNITEKNVMQELAAVGFSNVKDLVEWGTKRDDATGAKIDYLNLNPSESLKRRYSAAIKSIKMTSLGEIQLKTHNKVGALGLIMKKMGLLNEDDRGNESASKEDHEALTGRVSELLRENQGK